MNANTPALTDIDTYAANERVDELNANTPALTDINTYARNERLSELATNTPALTDINTYAPLERLIELSTNTPASTNIDTYARNERVDELNANTPALNNIDTYATGARTSELSTNITTSENIDVFVDIFGNLNSAESFRNSLLSKNQDFTLGVDIAFGGTSAFLGISNLLIQGAIVRNIMTIGNDYNLLFKQYSPPPGVFAATNQSFTFVSLDAAANAYRTAQVTVNKQDQIVELNLLKTYGVSAPNETIYSFGQQITVNNYGTLTNAIRQYNVARNYYTINSTFGATDIVAAQKQLKSILDEISKASNSTNETYYSPNSNINNQQGTTFINSYTNTDILKGAQYKPNEKTNLSPSKQQTYLGMGDSDAADLLKPSSFPTGNVQTNPTYPAGTAGAMMAQTNPSDIVSNTFLKGESEPTDNSFGTTTRGVRNVINIISKSNIPLAQNYVRGQDTFYIGNDSSGSPIKKYQRYTYVNPYASSGKPAQKLDFSFTNYANGITMYFPPYIKSYRHDATANWTAHEFLGRPEPVYTYNNGNRSGSISFIVLTDYAEDVYMGNNDSKGQDITTGAQTNFVPQSDTISAIDSLNGQIIQINKDIADLNNQISNMQGKGSVGNLQTQISTLRTQKSDLQKQVNNLAKQYKSFTSAPYGEFLGGSDYSKSIDASQASPWSPAETSSYINDVINNMMFVPAFFSGSKVDFLTKMDFLTKLTRPAKNTSGSGFAFTKPPVCHINLGAWFNWDIVVENVSYDYSDSVWTLDDNFNARVQPMYATVDVTFKIVGSYGGGGTPPLATDIGGIFNLKTITTNDSNDSSAATSATVVPKSSNQTIPSQASPSIQSSPAIQASPWVGGS